jgi:hypothetical protein
MRRLFAAQFCNSAEGGAKCVKECAKDFFHRFSAQTAGFKLYTANISERINRSSCHFISPIWLSHQPFCYAAYGTAWVTYHCRFDHPAMRQAHSLFKTPMRLAAKVRLPSQAVWASQAGQPQAVLLQAAAQARQSRAS